MFSIKIIDPAALATRDRDDLDEDNDLPTQEDYQQFIKDAFAIESDKIQQYNESGSASFLMRNMTRLIVQNGDALPKETIIQIVENIIEDFLCVFEEYINVFSLDFLKEESRRYQINVPCSYDGHHFSFAIIYFWSYGIANLFNGMAISSMPLETRVDDPNWNETSARQHRKQMIADLQKTAQNHQHRIAEISTKIETFQTSIKETQEKIEAESVDTPEVSWQNFSNLSGKWADLVDDDEDELKAKVDELSANIKQLEKEKSQCLENIDMTKRHVKDLENCPLIPDKITMQRHVISRVSKISVSSPSGEQFFKVMIEPFVYTPNAEDGDSMCVSYVHTDIRIPPGENEVISNGEIENLQCLLAAYSSDPTSVKFFARVNMNIPKKHRPSQKFLVHRVVFSFRETTLDGVAAILMNRVHRPTPDKLYIFNIMEKKMFEETMREINKTTSTSGRSSSSRWSKTKESSPLIDEEGFQQVGSRDNSRRGRRGGRGR